MNQHSSNAYKKMTRGIRVSELAAALGTNVWETKKGGKFGTPGLTRVQSNAGNARVDAPFQVDVLQLLL